MTATATPTTRSSSGFSAPPGWWRLFTIVIAAVSVAVVATWLAIAAQQEVTRDPLNPDIALRAIDITSENIAPSDSLSYRSLSHQSAVVSGADQTTATSVDVLAGSPTLVGVYAGETMLVGLAIVRPDEDTATITPESSARALLTMAPGLLTADLDATLQRVDVISGDDSFASLVDAFATQPNLSEPNEVVESALAAILDRLPPEDPVADQGCDSVSDSAAYPATGSCVRPVSNGIEINNEQNRWAVLFGGADLDAVCAAVAPSAGSATGGQFVLQGRECDGRALLVAPGPANALAEIDPDILVNRIRVASMLTTTDEWVAPFVSLAGTSSSAPRAMRSTIDAPAQLIAELGRLTSDPTVISHADGVSGEPATIGTRLQATIGLATTVIFDPSIATSFDLNLSARANLAPLLTFYDRTGQRMTAARTTQRWQARSADLITIAAAE